MNIIQRLNKITRSMWSEQTKKSYDDEKRNSFLISAENRLLFCLHEIDFETLSNEEANKLLSMMHDLDDYALELSWGK